MGTRIFFTCDMHGSERCFLKFVNSAKTYKGNVIIINGDLTGKAIVPIIRQGDGTYSAEFLGEVEKAKSDEELRYLEKRIRSTGYYSHIITPEERDELAASKTKLNGLFSNLVLEQVGRWVKIAEDRLRGSGARCFIMPGNDDMLEIDGTIAKSDYVVNPANQVVMIDDVHEMISLGYSNPTPWNTPRECSEEKLWEMIESLAAQVKDMHNCIFNFHVPPYDTGLDLAPELDKDLRPSVSAAGMSMVPVGSLSVRRCIEEHQPLLGLFGHIHESSCEARIGRTLCLNPGSEYHEGLLRGYVIDLDGDKVQHFRVEG